MEHIYLGWITKIIRKHSGAFLRTQTTLRACTPPRKRNLRACTCKKNDPNIADSMLTYSKSLSKKIISIESITMLEKRYYIFSLHKLQNRLNIQRQAEARGWGCSRLIDNLCKNLPHSIPKHMKIKRIFLSNILKFKDSTKCVVFLNYWAIVEHYVQKWQALSTGNDEALFFSCLTGTPNIDHEKVIWWKGFITLAKCQQYLAAVIRDPDNKWV